MQTRWQRLLEKVQYIQLDAHALGSSSLGKSQKEVSKIFQQTIPEFAVLGPTIVLLDEVETLAADRQRMSLEANPIDAHRATDAALAGIDLLCRKHRNTLLIATTNYPKAVDRALLSRADWIEDIGPPNTEARKEIILDMLTLLAKKWPKVEGLKSHIAAYIHASDGMDGRRLRKAITAAGAISIETAKDLNRAPTGACPRNAEARREPGGHPGGRRVKVRRNIASIPKRSAAQTWRAITDLVTGSGSVDAATLTAAASVMESLIADEHLATVPIMVKGVGSRLVIYCLYGEDAMEADTDVEKLNWNPTAGNWAMTAPTDAGDVAWMSKTLKERAPRIMVHDVRALADEEEETSSSSQALKIDWGALG